MSSSVSKIVAERNHRILLELVLKPGNDVCADCRARAPRWASHNLGIFICVNCASIHRKIGTHITKVKSISLDQWSKEQVEVMKEMGNIKSNALYNPNEARHPPPTNMMDTERDSDLERFIRSKYEFKRFIDRKSDATASTAARSRSTPLTDPVKTERESSPGPLPPPKTPQNLPPGFHLSATVSSLSRSEPSSARSISQPLPPLTSSEKLTAAPPLKSPSAPQPSAQKPAGKVWEDLVSLQGPSQSSSLPLQYSPMCSTTPFPFQPQVPVLQQQPTMPGGAPNPFMKLSLGQINAAPPLVTSSMSVSTPSPQFPFVSSAPLSSPAFHLGSTNPFNQVPLVSSPAAGVNSPATFATGPNPFSSSSMPVPMPMSMSTPTTPSVQPVMLLPTGAAPLHTPPLPYGPPQTFTPVPALSFPPTSMPFSVAPAPAPTTVGIPLARNPFTSVGNPGQMTLSAGGEVTNPFSAMQMGQVGFPRTTVMPQAPFGATGVLGRQDPQVLHPQQQQQQQQQQPQQLGLMSGFGGWAVQGAPQGSL